jgi:hypothetical protein
LSTSLLLTSLSVVEDEVHVCVGLAQPAPYRPALLRLDDDVYAGEVTQQGGEV